ncbi:unknown [Singapore grouper iridovirus]|uniref:HTH cro/C1-type domain-containing protein n=1 Tax=Singapore grouper iridovirus TaxID=262968 RepID=Q5YFM2_9VIRU|nr:hypothetical protein ORF043R [Singapore grouper iridovirus]AAS18058.1 unknown [Singapore grouper iridovirus]WAU86752.1 hypothetical protein ORF043R [Singapore grouper iridovirus]
MKCSVFDVEGYLKMSLASYEDSKGSTLCDANSLEDLKSEVAQLTTTVEYAVTHLASLDGSIGALNYDVAAVKNNMHCVTSESASALEQYEVLTTKLAELEPETREIRDQVKLSAEMFTGLKTAAERLENVLAALAPSVATNSQDIQRLKTIEKIANVLKVDMDQIQREIEETRAIVTSNGCSAPDANAVSAQTSKIYEIIDTFDKFKSLTSALEIVDANTLKTFIAQLDTLGKGLSAANGLKELLAQENRFVSLADKVGLLNSATANSDNLMALIKHHGDLKSLLEAVKVIDLQRLEDLLGNEGRLGRVISQTDKLRGLTESFKNINVSKVTDLVSHYEKIEGLVGQLDLLKNTSEQYCNLKSITDQSEKFKDLTAEGLRNVTEQTYKLRDLASQAYKINDLILQYESLSDRAAKIDCLLEKIDKAAVTVSSIESSLDSITKTITQLDSYKLDKLCEQTDNIANLLRRRGDLDGMLTNLTKLETMLGQTCKIDKLCSSLNSIDQAKFDALVMKSDNLKNLTEQTVIVSQMTNSINAFDTRKLESLMGQYLKLHRFLGMTPQFKMMTDALAASQPAKLVQMAAVVGQLKELLTDANVHRFEKISNLVKVTDVEKYKLLFSADSPFKVLLAQADGIRQFANSINSIDAKKLKLILEKLGDISKVCEERR